MVVYPLLGLTLTGIFLVGKRDTNIRCQLKEIRKDYKADSLEYVAQIHRFEEGLVEDLDKDPSKLSIYDSLQNEAYDALPWRATKQDFERSKQWLEMQKNNYRLIEEKYSNFENWDEALNYIKQERDKTDSIIQVRNNEFKNDSRFLELKKQFPKELEKYVTSKIINSKQENLHRIYRENLKRNLEK